MPLLTEEFPNQTPSHLKTEAKELCATPKLPARIEIEPLSHPVQSRITVPGSKSITNRALILAALADGETTLRSALWSEDTKVMVDCLRSLGFEIEEGKDLFEESNRTLVVHGRNGTIPKGGSKEKPLELAVKNAGTAARFLAALVCLGKGYYKLTGVDRMKDRPFAALLEALGQLGYAIEAQNGRLPAVIHGTGPRAGKCHVKIDESSQFASALLLASRVGGWNVEIDKGHCEEAPYVEMTKELCKSFPQHGGEFQVEPDASSGSYFWAANWLLSQKWSSTEFTISVANWPQSGMQIDQEFPKFLPLPKLVSRKTDLGDSIMTAIAIAPFASHQVKFTHLGRLRVQECDRMIALYDQLKKCGAEIKMDEKRETLEVFPSNLQGAEIETYNDHRMAMCFAIIGLVVPGIVIKDPSCVKKTFPDFFQKMAALPSVGIGVKLHEPDSKVLLHLEETIAS